jgi:hypothetical protein
MVVLMVSWPAMYCNANAPVGRPSSVERRVAALGKVAVRRTCGGCRAFLRGVCSLAA